MSTKIIRLTAENVKRINAVEITPDGNLIVIAGKNGQGKTSVLDSIMYALAGAGSLPQKPVKRGEYKAVIELDLGDLLVKRTFTATGGTSLTVTTKEGVKLTSPQAVLDALVGKLSFDPLAFAQHTPGQRTETLRQLVGLDFSKQEAEKQKLYDERTGVNREVKTLESRLISMPKHLEVPDAEVSTASILDEQRKAAEHNAGNETKRRGAGIAATAARSAGERVGVQVGMCDETRNEIIRLQAKLAQQDAVLKQCHDQSRQALESADQLKSDVSKLMDMDLGPFVKRLSEVEASNAKVRQNKQHADIVVQTTQKQKASSDLTEKIEAIDKAKRESIADAKFPVDGLSISEDTGEVLFRNLPFDQASTAEQLRVSVAIGLALNSKLRVLLVRRGSDLDEGSLKMVADMASKADAQVWLEKVSEDGAVSVIIEDGYARVPIQEQESVAK